MIERPSSSNGNSPPAHAPPSQHKTILLMNARPPLTVKITSMLSPKNGVTQISNQRDLSQYLEICHAVMFSSLVRTQIVVNLMNGKEDFASTAVHVQEVNSHWMMKVFQSWLLVLKHVLMVPNPLLPW